MAVPPSRVKKHRKLIFLKSQFLAVFECVKLESNFFGLHTVAILRSRPRHDQSVTSPFPIYGCILYEMDTTGMMNSVMNIIRRE